MHSRHYPEDEAAIKSVIEKMTENFNRHDATATATIFTKDGDLVNVYGNMVEGSARN